MTTTTQPQRHPDIPRYGRLRNAGDGADWSGMLAHDSGELNDTPGTPPIKMRPAAAAERYSVSVAYLRRLERRDPRFPAPWRRAGVVLYDVVKLDSYFIPAPKPFVATSTGGAMLDMEVPAAFRSSRSACRRAAAAPSSAAVA